MSNNDKWCILLNTAPLLQPEPKDEVEWDGDGEVDVTVDLEENGLVEIEVRWKPELGRRLVRFPDPLATGS